MVGDAGREEGGVRATVADVLNRTAAWGVGCSDATAWARSLPDDSVHCIVTSPPYYALRDYGVSGQMGLEDTPAAYIAAQVALFRELRRALHPSGTCWVNIGDSYCTKPMGDSSTRDPKYAGRNRRGNAPSGGRTNSPAALGLKHKDLIGVPWMLAFALRDDGWYLRQDIIWHKPSPMPSNVTDRCTTAHEYLFLLTKSRRYFFDAQAIAEAAVTAGKPIKMADGWDTGPGGHTSVHREGREKGKNHGVVQSATRNKRSVWRVAEPMVRLREDLTPEQKATVIQELVRRGLV